MASAYCNSVNNSHNMRPALQVLKLKPNDKAILKEIKMQLERMVYPTENMKSLVDTLE